MSLIDLKGKVALVTGVADNVGFGWHIAKAFAGHGAQVIISTHPRIVSILERFLTNKRYEESRKLIDGSNFSPEAVIPCDVSVDVSDDLSDEQKNWKGYQGDISIAGMAAALAHRTKHVDVVVHSVAFSPEIERPHLDVSRKAYLTAMSVSSYSLIALSRAMVPFMEGRQGSIMALSFLASERAVPFYGGGMASAKAALECDARMLSWQLGELGHRVNIISPGPYPSRAAKAIGDMEAMVNVVRSKSPLKMCNYCK